MALGFRGHVAFHAGDLDEARPLLLDALDRFRGMNPRWAGWTLCQLAAADSRDAVDEGGDPVALAAAIGRYEEALGLFRGLGDEVGIARALHGIAYVAYKLRDLATALARTQEVLALDSARGWPVYHYLEDIADIAGRIGRPLAAARLYGAAAGQRARLDRPIEAIYLDEFARDEAVSRQALGEAAYAAAWEEGWALAPERAVAEALDLRIPPSRANRRLTGAALSPREVEIVALLATGRTHRAIGESLFISERTVDSHVARLFGKLGVRTRAEALAESAARGVIAPG